MISEIKQKRILTKSEWKKVEIGAFLTGIKEQSPTCKLNLNK